MRDLSADIIYLHAFRNCMHVSANYFLILANNHDKLLAFLITLYNSYRLNCDKSVKA